MKDMFPLVTREKFSALRGVTSSARAPSLPTYTTPVYRRFMSLQRDWLLSKDLQQTTWVGFKAEGEGFKSSDTVKISSNFAISILCSNLSDGHHISSRKAELA